MHKYFSNPKRRRLLIWSAVVLAGLLYYLFSGRSGIYHAMPTQLAMVVNINGIVKLNQLADTTSDAAWKAILQTNLFRTCRRDVALLEGIVAHDDRLKNMLLTGPLAAGLTLQDADSLHALFAVDLKYRPDLRALLQNAPAKLKFFPYNFKDRTLYTVHLNRQERLVLVQVGTLLIFSRFSYLVEDALAQLAASDAWWADRRHLSAFEPTAWVRIFIRPAGINTQIGSKLAPLWRQTPALLEKNMEWLGLAWNGQQTRAIAETQGALSRMDDWGPVERGALFGILPDHTALLAWAGFNNHSRFWDQMPDVPNSEFKRYILPWAGEEAAFVLTEPHSPDMREDQFVVLAVRDSAKALSRLRAYGADRGALNAAEYQTYEIFNFLNQAILAPLIGEPEAFRNPVCAMVGNYVVFAGNRSALEIWIDKFIVNQTLANNTDFLQLNNQLPAKSSGLILANMAYLPLLVGQLTGSEHQAANADAALLSHTGLLGIDLQPGRGKRLDLAFAWQTQANPVAETGILWKTVLSAEAATQPYVIGQPAEGIKILIQDTRHELYCLHNNGAVAWRRQIGAPLLSDVKGIDFFGNKTTCYFFNTAEHLWLLNAKGEDVEGFPLPLQSRATNGATVVDFNNNSRFSYFVACENNNLYGYDQFGRPLPGWNPQAGIGKVRQPLLHFQYDYKDYLAVLNERGTLFVYGHNGALRFPPLSLGGKFNSPLQLDASGKKPRIACANTAGTFSVCNIDGSQYSLRVGRTGRPAGIGICAPLTGDARFEYAMLQGAQLTIGGYEGGAFKILSSRQMPSPQQTIFAVAGQRLGTLDAVKRQIFLLDGRGGLHPDFPLAGTTPFAVADLFGKRGETVLLVGNGPGIYAYKIR